MYPGLYFVISNDKTHPVIRHSAVRCSIEKVKLLNVPRPIFCHIKRQNPPRYTSFCSSLFCTRACHIIRLQFVRIDEILCDKLVKKVVDILRRHCYNKSVNKNKTTTRRTDGEKVRTKDEY
nr:MAG TPA: hypothetical protein [Caudoviricetes sp.]